MTIERRTGDLFTTHAPAIGHGVNTTGVMGAGIAKEFRQRFPNMFTAYQQRCRNGALRPGDTYTYPAGHGRFVLNLATQDRPGKRARLPWVATAVQSGFEQLATLGVDWLALPRIGCGIGGLHWGDVEPILIREAAERGMTVEIWTLT